MLSLLDLFSGIGGFSLGLERTGGFKTVAFCEIDPFCRKVLAKHWPEVPIYDDVRTLTGERLRADGVSVNAICGGFPCQDISTAGKGAGITGERSGLWSEYARIIGELRPAFVIVENVAALLSRGLDRVLGDLASLGFDAEWHCIPASAIGAPHRRDRVWIVAYSECGGSQALRPERTGNDASPRGGREHTRYLQEVAHPSIGASVADAIGNGRSTRWHNHREHERSIACSSGADASVADPNQPRLEGWLRASLQKRTGERPPWDGCASIQYASDDTSNSTGIRRGVAAREWRFEPDVGRVAHGVSARVDRLKGLGNAVVPQIPELIGSAILASLKQAEAA